MNNQICQNATDCIIIGYYPLRGKAQICRLLCEYLHLPYKDLLFTPKTWQQFKIERKLNWTFQQLPFLKDGNTIVTQTYPMCLYILNKANRKILQGSNLLQEIKIDTYIWKTDPSSYLLTSLIDHRDMTPQVKADATQKLWARNLNQKLSKLQKEASEPFFFGELSLLDFYIYQTFYFLEQLSPERLDVFPKLMKICINFYNIPEITAYENSKKSIKEVCPTTFCINWRQRCGRVSQ